MREGVIDRVLHQLVQDDGQRGRDDPGELPRRPLDTEVQPLLVGRH